MKKNFKKIASVIIAAGLMVGLVGCGNKNLGNEVKADADGLKTVRVGIMTGAADQYATFIGEEEGIFKKYGIKLETAEYASGINTVDAIQNGTADTGLLADFAAANRFGKTLHATNLAIFSELCVSAPTDGGLYVDSKYADNLESLNNSNGWVTKIGTVSEYYNWQAQTYIGVDPAKQNIVQSDSNQTNLALAQTGDASAIVAYGAEGSKYEEIGWKLAAKADDIGIRVGSYLITTSDFLKNNTELLADYLKALKESIDYITENLDDAAVRVETKFGIKAEDFKKNWNSQKFRIGFTEEGALQLDKLNEWAYTHGRYEEEYNIRDFIHTSAAEIAIPENVTIQK